MILIIKISKEKFHDLEFSKPIEDILKSNRVKFFTKSYSLLTKKDLDKASKVIICGTSLKDFDYFNNIEKFSWIKEFDKPVFGICAGMQVMAHFLGGEFYLKGKKTDSLKEIGMTKICFSKDFLGFNGNIEAYELHQLGIGKQKGLKNSYATSNKGIQAMKWENNKYGVLFHPEVRNKELILNFVKNG